MINGSHGFRCNNINRLMVQTNRVIKDTINQFHRATHLPIITPSVLDDLRGGPYVQACQLGCIIKDELQSTVNIIKTAIDRCKEFQDASGKPYKILVASIKFALALVKVVPMISSIGELGGTLSAAKDLIDAAEISGQGISSVEDVIEKSADAYSDWGDAIESIKDVNTDDTVPVPDEKITKDQFNNLFLEFAEQMNIFTLMCKIHDNEPFKFIKNYRKDSELIIKIKLAIRNGNTQTNSAEFKLLISLFTGLLDGKINKNTAEIVAAKEHWFNRLFGNTEGRILENQDLKQKIRSFIIGDWNSAHTRSIKKIMNKAMRFDICDNPEESRAMRRLTDDPLELLYLDYYECVRKEVQR